MSDDIEFVGVVVRRKNGETRAIDLSGTDAVLTVAVKLPHNDEDELTAFGSRDRYVGGMFKNVDIAVHGELRPNGTKLGTTRIVADGTPPFPAFGDAE